MCVRNAMTRILTGFALVLVLSTTAPAWARAHTSVAVDVGFFYDDLAPHGDWVQVRQHGWVWVPRVDDDWRPYAFGHWVWTDDYGWLWESDEDFGWAAYHYGRWYWDPLYGWVWVPGYEWGPAWVSFRYGGGYVGWAPLPPRVEWVVGIGLRFGGASIDALIEPRAYTFCEERAFFAPAVHRHVLSPSRNAAIISVTRNVTDYDVVGARVVGRGPSVDRLETRLGRRAPRVRVVEVDSAREARGRRSQRDAVAIFRPEVRPRADAPPPRGKAIERREARERRQEGDRQRIERRREAEEREARMRARRQREEMGRARKDLERRQAAERKEMEKKHKQRRPPEPRGLGRRQEQEHRAIDERQDRERRRSQASQEEVRRRREARASAGHGAASREQGRPPSVGKGTAGSGQGKKPEGKRPKAKPDRKARKDDRR